MIRAFVLYCYVVNPSMCVSLEIVPADGHRITSPMECLMGTAIFDAQTRITQQTPEGLIDGRPMTFKESGIEWFVKRSGCRTEVETAGNDEIKDWVKAEKARQTAVAPQVK